MNPDLLKDLKKVNPINGSYFALNGYNYRMTNTCTIDYFIIIMAIVGKFNKRVDLITRENWKKLFTELSKYVFTQNNWDLARYCFLTFKNHMASVRNNKDISYDCHGSEYPAYMDIYNEVQIIEWEQQYPKPKSGFHRYLL